jgi:putative transposase
MARRQHNNSVGALRRTVDSNCAKVSLAAAIAKRLILQYRDHPHWSYQLHHDNLTTLVKANPSLGAPLLLFHSQALHAD